MLLGAAARCAVDQAVAAAWVAPLEAALWSKVEKFDYHADAVDTSHHQQFLAIIRAYRGDVRRIVSALRDPMGAPALLAQLRGGELTPAALAAMPPQDLLPGAKRAKLGMLSTGPREAKQDRALPNADAAMVCVECGRSGSVSWGRRPGVDDGYGNPDSWGSAGNDDRGNLCRAHCTACLAEWDFER